jgi:hypothetical protein
VSEGGCGALWRSVDIYKEVVRPFELSLDLLDMRWENGLW